MIIQIISLTGNPELDDRTYYPITGIATGGRSSPTSASLTGILVGDVNNSWIIPS